jgi:DoxX-like family
MISDAALFPFGAGQHLSLRLGRFHGRTIIGAAIVEYNLRTVLGRKTPIRAVTIGRSSILGLTGLPSMPGDLGLETWDYNSPPWAAEPLGKGGTIGFGLHSFTDLSIPERKGCGGKIMQTSTQTVPVSRRKLWAGRIISGLVVLFLLFDSVAKLMRVAPVLEACTRLGIPQNLVIGIGSVLLACVVVYVIPRTSVLGAILLTGYLGGAVATQLRAGSPLFDTLFPIIFGVLIWAGIFLRDNRVRILVPLRS